MPHAERGERAPRPGAMQGWLAERRGGAWTVILLKSPRAITLARGSLAAPHAQVPFHRRTSVHDRGKFP